MNEVEGKAPIIGIDLGTTYSLVAVLQSGEPTLLPNAMGQLLTPSAVSVDEKGTVLVGAAARARAITHPEETALSFKRDMGTDITWTLGGKKLTPQDLSALVLKTLKQDAEAALGCTVSEAVVTVPAYFGDAQRQATRDAGAIAGLTVERIINEPTAAALAYGLHALGTEQKLAVMDLGGGTFDVTVLEIIEGCIEVQSSAGDARLGGEDFVDRLVDWFLKRLRDGHGDVELSPAELARVRSACEEAKVRLTELEHTRVAISELELAGRARDVEYAVEREEAQLLWQPLLDRIRAPVLRALRDAGLAPEQIDEVVLVGGATRMPCVVKLATQLFGRLPLRSLPPDEAVAMGAAVQAGLKQGDAAVEDLVATDVAPFTLGIATGERMGVRAIDGIFSPILERGTVIPTSRVERFFTLDDDQTQINVEVYQGEHATCSRNQLLGKYTVKGIPRSPAGEQAVDVRLSYDLNGILEVETTVVSTGKKATLVIEEQPGKLTRGELERAIQRLQKLKFHPRDALPNVTAVARAEALFVELTGEARRLLGAALAQIRLALESQDPETIQQAREQLVALTERLRRGNRASP
jgi:molecular chaperone HscC